MTHRHLSAIMFTDIAGYTSVMEVNEPSAIAMVGKLEDVLERTVPEHLGKILHYYGDGSLCIFDSASDAVRCAMDIQKQLIALEVPIRLGIHLGEILQEGNKVFGDGVNIASRIESSGTPGAILFSKAVYEQIRNNPDFQCVSLGALEYKNVIDPVEIFALANKGFPVPKRSELSGKLKPGSRFRPFYPTLKRILALSLFIILVLYFVWVNIQPSEKAGALPEPNTIAVLPFENLSKLPAQDYFCDGLVATIHNRLTELSDLRVRSMTSSEKYRATSKSIAKIGSELQVGQLLKGSLYADRDSIRVIVHLVDVQKDENIWSQAFHRSRTENFELQSDIARQVAEKLNLSLNKEDRQLLARPLTTNPLAYDLYLRALEQKNRAGIYNLGSYYTALDFLGEALELDTSFLQALILTSVVHTELFFFSKSNQESHREKAWVYLQKAEALRSNDAQVQLQFGNYWFYLFNDLDRAIGRYRKANDINGKLGLYELGICYSIAGNIPLALYYLNRLVEIDPTLRRSANAEIGYCLGRIGQYKLAEEYLEEALRVEADNLSAEQFFFDLLLAQRKFREAGELLQVQLETNPGWANYEMGVLHLFQRNWKKAESYYSQTDYSGMDLGLIYLHTSRTKEGVEILNKAIPEKNLPLYWYDAPRIYAALEEEERTYAIFDEILQRERIIFYPWMPVDPFYDSLRDKPRFQEYERTFEDLKEEMWNRVKGMDLPDLTNE